MQSTYSEWVAYRRAGGAETCQGCHMPQGRHVMSGAHDVELLRGALAVAVSDGALTVTSVGVGHSFPTGDVFRHLTVEVREDGGAPGAWRVVARLGRRFDTRLDGETLLARKVETADTSLRPGEARVVRLPAAAKSWRVRSLGFRRRRGSSTKLDTWNTWAHAEKEWTGKGTGSGVVVFPLQTGCEDDCRGRNRMKSLGRVLARLLLGCGLLAFAGGSVGLSRREQPVRAGV